MTWHTAWSEVLDRITTEDREEEFWEGLRKNIEECDFACMGVVADDGTTFSYTVGFWGTLQHPEILIVGIHPEYAAQFMWLLHNRIEAGEVFEAGEFYSEVIEKFDVTFAEIPAPYKPLNIAHTLYEGEMRALQLIFPDPEGKFPGEDGYSEKFAAKQRLADGQWD